MPKKIDRTGKRYGRLVVLEDVGRDRWNQVLWRCACDCGKEAVVIACNLGRSTNSCGCLAKEKAAARGRSYKGPANPSWKGGGRRAKDNGYMCVWTPQGRRLEHRHVMEKSLGRALKPHETVHHINGDRADNRIENLELWSKSQPAGQRVEDKLAWAHRLLAEYEDEWEGIPR